MAKVKWRVPRTLYFSEGQSGAAEKIDHTTSGAPRGSLSLPVVQDHRTRIPLPICESHPVLG